VILSVRVPGQQRRLQIGDVSETKSRLERYHRGLAADFDGRILRSGRDE
jgi:hypothetical protein